jgi:hypothetical protein
MVARRVSEITIARWWWYGGGERGDSGEMKMVMIRW